MPPKTPPTEQVDTMDAPLAAATVSADSPSQGAPVTRSPGQWAEVFFPDSDRGRMHPEIWKHGAAAMLHGWLAYETRSGHPPQLTSEQYAAACEAVSGNDYRPHAAADYRTRS